MCIRDSPQDTQLHWQRAPSIAFSPLLVATRRRRRRRSSAVMWSDAHQRPLFPIERLVAMMLPATLELEASTGYSCPFKDSLGSASDFLLEHVSGNGMHIGVFGAVFLVAVINMPY
eukprot:343059-Alexandrium_andersonii.AAC.1